MSLEHLLSRLERVRKAGPNRWVACCPAHNDKSPSLSISDANGKVLVHCFGGCSTEEVLAVTGLTFADLMPEPLEHNSPRVRKPYSDRELLTLLAFEATTVACIAAKMRAGDNSEMDRLITAAGRINAALDMANL